MGLSPMTVPQSYRHQRTQHSCFTGGTPSTESAPDRQQVPGSTVSIHAISNSSNDQWVIAHPQQLRNFIKVDFFT
jgi:hypothetical protein